MIDKCYIIPVQNMCNCDCTFCISKDRNYNKKEELLQIDEKFINNIQLIKKRNIKRIEITGGGEPFLHPNLDIIIKAIKEIIPDSYIKIYTNGFIQRKINGIDEINISTVSDIDKINNSFMNPNNPINFYERIMYFKENYKDSKLRLSIPLIQGGIDTESKLSSLIDNTTYIVDEYVVRTLYKNCKLYKSKYVELSINNPKVIYEKDNDKNNFSNLVLWSDNNFYTDFTLNKKRYLYTYILLKPDSRNYINEIDKLISDSNLEVVSAYIINDFNNQTMLFYQEKDIDYQEVIQRHLNNLSYLFGNNALIYILDKNSNYETLAQETYELKLKIRKLWGFTENKKGYILKDNNISHLNLCHTPDADISLFDRDLDIIENLNKQIILPQEHKTLKKYRSYYL